MSIFCKEALHNPGVLICSSSSYNQGRWSTAWRQMTCCRRRLLSLSTSNLFFSSGVFLSDLVAFSFSISYHCVNHDFLDSLYPLSNIRAMQTRSRTRKWKCDIHQSNPGPGRSRPVSEPCTLCFSYNGVTEVGGRWVIQYENDYLMTFTLNDNITIYRSPSLT